MKLLTVKRIGIGEPGKKVEDSATDKIRSLRPLLLSFRNLRSNREIILDVVGLIEMLGVEEEDYPRELLVAPPVEVRLLSWLLAGPKPKVNDP